ncbi:MAG TPA: tRNA (N(6)-L-threonylcarbamoyladenosine(37)-C(2))-methylthiotransferase MtaB [Candidatus Copromorpha excrementipullorum]|uniref:Threonylcarbamoyladenosine tRNA methylthiotransferase MtaB n=1 Tax=Candidatus Allocopromorpha excrementipullorum TaxID=2840743 RepID=A0A9D1N656_9FIRM|nr:tRNA (N(6)-L-threonylcarbamoyladenosine(37)-C(2))-methylthiotransferase MtaB [Candidatus Copromorpha excrementipullorum]
MKVAFHTLGCKVNQYETEAMAEKFRKEGYQVVGERELADVYVINTCTVTAVADKKSRQYIRKMKKINPESVVVVTGCYAQIKPDEVSSVEGVDIVTGTNEKGRLPEYVSRYMDDGVKQLHIKGYDELDVYDEMGAVASVEGRTRAYIKIQEGCNRFCSYCVIPYARGKVRSRALREIIAEAEGLVAAGYKELVLTGINTALYGMENRSGAGGADEDGEGELYGVEAIIARMNEIPGDFRIRLSSLEPAVVNADYVKRLLKYDKLCHHLHLSAQSGSDNVLSAMNRPYGRKEYMDIVEVLKAFDPLYGISTDIIVGFPGEREADFQESVSLVEKCGFCRTHVFKYSKRPFTRAAGMKGHIAPQVKNRRGDELSRAGKESARRFFQMNLGTSEKVLLEEIHQEKMMITGYTGNYIRVYIPFDDEAAAERLLGKVVSVRLTGLFADGMTGEIL